MIDAVHRKTGLIERLSLSSRGQVFEIDCSAEPTTILIDQLVETLRSKEECPELIVGIGGGTAMDISKAVSVMLTNPGRSSDYQGWDLPKNPSIPKVGIPTLSGTGAEVSRTAVLTGPEKKLGINSKFSQFDLVICDPELIESVDHDQEFYSAMDCYIHCVESLTGTIGNPLGLEYAQSGLNGCVEYFLGGKDRDHLMVSSFFGGCAIGFTEVGICHALSYGLSLVLGFGHGLSNCIVFNQLDEYYGDHVSTFRKMSSIARVDLPQGVTQKLSPGQFDVMVNMASRMDKPLVNALGENWRSVFGPGKMTELYRRM